MRIPLLLTFLMLSTSSIASGDAPGVDYQDPAGWQWYQDPEKYPDDEEIPAPAPTPPMTASEEKKQIQDMTQAALDTAILYPTPENIRKYRILQDFWTNQAGDFTQGWKKALLLYPELDYNLKYSHYNGAAAAQQANDRAREKTAIAELAGQYGVFFFYRGNDPMDKLMATVMKGFSEENKIAVLPVTMDGEVHPAFPESRKDTGQAARMNIKYFPALYLFDAKTETYRPLAYGFKSQDDLARSFYNVASDFKANF